MEFGQQELGHNPLSLPAHKRVRVHNYKRAQAKIRKLMDILRPRGMKLRHTYDFVNKDIYLSARTTGPVEKMVRELRADGNVVFVDERRERL